MLRKLHAPLTSLVLALTLIAGVAAFRSQRQGSDDVLAVEKGALDRWGNGDVEGYLSIYDDSITYCDPFQDGRVDGAAALRALYGPIAGKFKVDRYEFVKPRVQRSGEIAVLTFGIQNYAKQPDGTEKPSTRWNVTEVFQRKGGRWRTIHSHFSFTKPDIRPPA